MKLQTIQDVSMNLYDTVEDNSKIKQKKIITARDKKILRLNFKSKSRTAGGKRRNWLELPKDVTVLILSPLGAIEILESVQRVCMAWRNICKNQPLMCRTIDMHNDGDLDEMPYNLEKMCRLAVDRSCGTLVYINVEHFGTDDLLKDITDK
ncbi:hypothetical protein EV1_004585 [Malus domestica]